MKVVAIVDDERDITELVAFHLQREGFSVRKFFSGENFLRSLTGETFDCIILDIMLPGIDGISIAKFLKTNEKTQNIPIIILTAKSSEADIVLGLEIGADDYVTKPFSPRVLATRVKTLMRKEKSAELINKGKITIDAKRYKVTCNGNPLILTATEFKILKVLIKNEEKVFTRDELLDRVWGFSNSPMDRTVDVHIRNLREKLGKYAYYIKTARGVGYKFSLEK